ncbi:MAG: tetratricopeptide repeat protein [Gemmatimonadales bacterium]
MPHRLALLLVAVCAPLPSLAAQAPATPRPKGAVELRADSLLRAGNPAEAERLYRQVAQSDSTLLRAWYGVGNAAVAQQRIAEAAEAFERAAVGGRLIAAVYNAGAMHSRLGHVDQAFVWLERAVTAGLVQPSQYASDPDLAAVRADPRFAGLMQRVQATFAPCESDPDARRFDFWVGEWDVSPSGAPTVAAGRSSVQRVSGGCALLENWTASNGSVGKSLNAFNKATGQWQQYWVGQGGGVVEFRESRWDGPTLVLRTVGGTPWQRLSFTPIDSNTVRQFGETSSDSGKTWQVGYDFRYRRRP